MTAEAAPNSPTLNRSTYWLTRFVLLRVLGLVYAAAFLAAARQILPLIGSQGLLPLDPFLHRVRDYLGSTAAGFARFPSIFWFWHSDAALLIAAWTGFGLACVVVLGFANAPMLAVLWALYMSFVHSGQDWYGYGWETQLLETGFLAIFLCPLVDPRPFPRRAPPTPLIWLFRWLIFRIMLGAGLIKLRGDRVWRDLTALYYHFETQPIPGPLSRWFHFLPRLALRAGVMFNHVAEIIAPWFVFWPRTARRVAGVVIILFQISLILSGNLSFLNWITIVPALACLDDAFWARILPNFLVRRATHAAAHALPSKAMRTTGLAVAGLVILLSFQPVMNLLSARQMMNTSFDPLDLVNTYGAFGSVGRERLNIVFEGTNDAVANDDAAWKAYPYKDLPVELDRAPPQIAPYQPRLDWQMWFAAMGTPGQYQWTLHLVWKLLHNDPGTLSLFGGNPLPRPSAALHPRRPLSLSASLRPVIRSTCGGSATSWAFGSRRSRPTIPSSSSSSRPTAGCAEAGRRRPRANGARERSCCGPRHCRAEAGARPEIAPRPPAVGSTAPAPPPGCSGSPRGPDRSEAPPRTRRSLPGSARRR